ncbi:cystathionine beta-synthase-like protein isoform X2 [Corticium candelabrum]|uniref:cystathionine beta-synthase-like protein isoform X2 n=1 Tax=Corticium candelabrum TaxID=121492 RepID=UPI002E263A6D|nr:cystathionine beta-synthase-like protein isoform X2 [Corticium candelabrum]
MLMGSEFWWALYLVELLFWSPKPKPHILPNILHHIGETPLVRINKIGATYDIKCQLLAKCEYFNAGGSVKDRIGVRMIEDAERDGRLNPESVIIEPTTGNTGIGLALCAAVKGYKCIVVMPENMSNEKVDILRALGADIVRTPAPTLAAFDSPESDIGMAQRLNKEIPNSIILNQYRNPGNPLAHYDKTAEELIEQCEGKLDMIVLTAGTGGTITGIGRKIKEKLPSVKIIGVDPFGSLLAQPDVLNESGVKVWKVEGIGYDFIPTVLDRSVVDYWVKVNDRDSFLFARRLIKEEGLLCGESSGAALAAAVQTAKGLREDQRCVVLLPDSVRDYMPKILSDDWMTEQGYLDKAGDAVAEKSQQWQQQTVGHLKLKPPITVKAGATCGDCIDILNKHNYDQLLVLTKGGEILGMVTLGNLRAKLSREQIKQPDPATDMLYKNFKMVHLWTSLDDLSSILEKHHFAVAIQKHTHYSEVGKATENQSIYGIVTSIDLWRYKSN